VIGFTGFFIEPYSAQIVINGSILVALWALKALSEIRRRIHRARRALSLSGLFADF
jgi:hypothetical protein